MFKLTKPEANQTNTAAINTGPITTTTKFIALWGEVKHLDRREDIYVLRFLFV